MGQEDQVTPFNEETALAAFCRGDYEEVLRSAVPHAEAGEAGAQCMLSLLYQCGYGVEQDTKAAEKWLLRAAEQQNAVAWNNLGTLYCLGWPGVPRDHEKALECYLRAKDLGFDCACPYPPTMDFMMSPKIAG